MKRIFNFIIARIRKTIFQEIWIKDYVRLGMKIGNNCNILSNVVFDYSFCWMISLGNNVTIAPEAFILAHDASTKRVMGYAKVGRVTIEDNVFIGARSIIMPGVTVGENSIIGTGSVVTKNVPANSVYVGNPAKLLCTTDEYYNKMRMLMEDTVTYDQSYTISGNIDGEKKAIMYKELENIKGFVF